MQADLTHAATKEHAIKAAMLVDMATISSYSLSIDTWTSLMNIGYLAVTVYGINEDWERKNFFLGLTHVSCSETAEFIRAMVSKSLMW